MADGNFEINWSVRGVPLDRAYDRLAEQIESLLVHGAPLQAALSTVACVLHFGFENRWTGFYLASDGALVVGPYQGPLAPLVLAPRAGPYADAFAQGRSVLDGKKLGVPLFDPAWQVRGVLGVESGEKSLTEQDRKRLEGIVEAFLKPRW